MSKKGKGGKPRRGAHLLEIATRELSKGDTKNALRNAKVCYRESPDPPVRRLLESAYVGRIEQLQQRNLAAEAKAVLADLLELGPTEPTVISKLAGLRVALADPTINAREVLDKDPGLMNSLVDQAILDSRQLPASISELGTQVDAVRQALAAVERADDVSVARLLELIPRGSPLADWKLFARGLSSFYQSDAERWRQNWMRLDPTRPAARIAQTLLVATGEPAISNFSADVTRQVEHLRNRLSPPGLINDLQELAELWEGPDGDPFFDLFVTLRQRFGASHPGLITEIVELIGRRAIRYNDPTTMKELIATGSPPILDPRWQRLRAMVAERSSRASAKQVAKYWNAYADDLRSTIKLPAEEVPIAVGLVYLRLGRHLGSAAESGMESKSVILDAIATYRKCVDTTPRLLEAFRELAELLDDEDEPKQAAEVRQRLIAEFPDDVEAHFALAEFFLQEDDSIGAEPHVTAMSRLVPRDPRCLGLQWSQKLAEVRRLAKAKKYGAAREAMILAAESKPADVASFALPINLAGIAFRAKEPEVAERHIQEALATVSEPTSIWLLMSYVAARYGLPRPIKKRFDDLYKEAIEGKIKSETAAAVASHFTALIENSLNYTGRATQQRLFVSSLRRANWFNWPEADLVSVGRFAMHLPREWKLRKMVTAEGWRRFPKNAFFALWAGELEFANGPYGVNRDMASKFFSKALEFAPTTAGFGPGHCESARDRLSQIEDMRQQFSRGFGFHDDFDDDDFDDDDFEDDDSEDDGYEDDGFEDDDSPFAERDFRKGFGSPSPMGAGGMGFPPLPPGIPVPLLAKALEKMMPNEMREVLEAESKKSGLPMLKVIEMFLRDGGK